MPVWNNDCTKSQRGWRLVWMQGKFITTVTLSSKNTGAISESHVHATGRIYSCIICSKRHQHRCIVTRCTGDGGPVYTQCMCLMEERGLLHVIIEVCWWNSGRVCQLGQKRITGEVVRGLSIRIARGVTSNRWDWFQCAENLPSPCLSYIFCYPLLYTFTRSTWQLKKIPLKLFILGFWFSDWGGESWGHHKQSGGWVVQQPGLWT